MNILADNPVFQREARWGRRLRRLRHNKPLAFMVACITFVIGWLYWQGLNLYANPQTPGDNGGLWRLCSSVYLGLIVLLAPVLASSAISQEKEQQTWEALATTKLTAPQILVGKWLARLIPLGWIAALLLPLLVISAPSGIDMSMLPTVLLFLALTAATYGLIGLTCSFIARKTLAATTISLVITCLLCIGTWIAHSLLLGLSQTGGDFALMMRYSGLPSPLWVNPFYVLSLLTDYNTVSGGQSYPYVNAPHSQGYYVGNSFGGYYGYGESVPNVAGVVTAYGIVSLLVIAFCFYYMFTRYRRTVRGGHPLGETLK